MEILEFMFIPFIACILLISINVYFGIHVLKREIIFIDIALAQIAALGGVIAEVIHQSNENSLAGHGHEGQPWFTFTFSFIFCALAALVFSLLKNKKIKIPLEALIGIAYAVATTAAVIILDKSAGGDVHIHDMLTGAILWVGWHEVTILAIVISLVGAFHFIFRKKFFKLTDNYHKADTGVKNKGLWDFLFYFSFGLVIVQAVSVGGILTVFAFLIIPASISSLYANHWSSRIFIGLGVGAVVTILGLYFSWQLDVPSSPVIILFLGVVLMLSLIFKKIFRKQISDN
ncbi:MAG: metal ABC transporter permease [Prolixibacteraceae bacterium]|nr:metal ABC transporter permease [Prolixibacteraceae bacterium]MBN2773650.1 metal ABC transporter permease [Prolixibacteraceae bacterium]